MSRLDWKQYRLNTRNIIIGKFIVHLTNVYSYSFTQCLFVCDTMTQERYPLNIRLMKEWIMVFRYSWSFIKCIEPKANSLFILVLKKNIRINIARRWKNPEIDELWYDLMYRCSCSCLRKSEHIRSYHWFAETAVGKKVCVHNKTLAYIQ